MTAKEYLEENGYQFEIADPVVTESLELWMEQYHTLKSREEAEERYEKAKETYLGISGSSEYVERHYPGVVKALRIAAGKEEG